MIKGFEKITSDYLSGREVKAAIIIFETLEALPRGECIRAKDLDAKVKELTGRGIHGGRIRKVIHIIRTHFMPDLCATQKGYFRAKSLTQLQDYELSLGQRQRSIGEVRTAIRRHIKVMAQSQTYKR